MQATHLLEDSATRLYFAYHCQQILSVRLYCWMMQFLKFSTNTMLLSSSKISLKWINWQWLTLHERYNDFLGLPIWSHGECCTLKHTYLHVYSYYDLGQASNYLLNNENMFLSLFLFPFNLFSFCKLKNASSLSKLTLSV